MLDDIRTGPLIGVRRRRSIRTRAVSRREDVSFAGGSEIAAYRIREVRRALPADAADRATEFATELERSRARCDAHRYRIVRCLILALCDAISLTAAEAMRRSSELAPDNPTYTQCRERSGITVRRACGQIDLHAISSRQEANANDFIPMRCRPRAASELTRSPSDPLARSSSALEAPCGSGASGRCAEGKRVRMYGRHDTHEYQRYLHQLIAFEINTVEAVSRHIAEFSSMPWEFHWDMACPIRDELSPSRCGWSGSHMRTVH